MKEKRMRDEDRLIGIAFDDKYDDNCPCFHVFENEDDLIEFIGDYKDEIGEYFVYEMRRILLNEDRILH
jgi:hypothetical protein